jgi:hypothetical protein
MSAPNFSKTKRGANGKFLPKPLLFHLRTPNSKKNEPKFWQILSPKNSFAKTSSTELALEFRQFLLWRNPTSPATTIPKKENGSRGKSKQNAWWRGEGGATERERKNTVVPDSVLKWTLRRDGIRRGAYDYISHHHTLGACEVITSLCFGNRCEFGTIQTPEWNLAVENQPRSGRAVGTPTLFRPFSPMNSPMNSDSRLRRNGLFFRQEAGAKSEAILTNSICLIQKEFLSL